MMFGSTDLVSLKKIQCNSSARIICKSNATFPIAIETLEIQTEDDLEDGEYEAIEIIRPLELPMKM